MKCSVLTTVQNDNKLLTFSISAKELLKYVHFKSRFDDGEEGVQRAHNVKKSKMIAEGIKEGELTIPNSIIVNMNLRSNGLKLEDVLSDDILDLDVASKIFIEKGIPLSKLFFVIDGQHRLRAFEDQEVPDFNLIVTAYVDLYIAEVANLFVQINYYQKPVDKSIVFDLLGINEEIFPEYAKYHKVVHKLNNNIESPFFNQIKMLGTGVGLISQASLISAIEKYRIEKRLSPFIGTIEENEMYSLFYMYFKSISEVYPQEWREKNTLLTKSIGIRTMIKLIPDIIDYIINKNNVFSIDDKAFSIVIQKLDIGVKNDLKTRLDIIDKNVWVYFSTLGIGGEGGISNLYNYFISILRKG